MEKVYLRNSLLKPLFVLFFFVLATVDSFAHDNSLLKIFVKDSHVSAEIRDAPLVKVVKKLSKETGIRFTYTSLPEIKVFSKIENQPLEKGIKEILPLNTVFVHSDMLSIGALKNNRTIKSVIILSSLKRSYSLTSKKNDDENTSQISKLETSEANHRHAGYQSGIGSLTQKVEESVVAYHWLSQLKNPDFLIRLEAIKELGQLGSDTALQALYLALGDKNQTVREEAQYRLKEIDSNRWFNSIEEQLVSANPTTQNSALDIIQTQKGDRWVRLLEASAQNQSLSPELRKKAAETLLKIKKK